MLTFELSSLPIGNSEFDAFMLLSQMLIGRSLPADQIISNNNEMTTLFIRPQDPFFTHEQTITILTAPLTVCHGSQFS